MINIQCEIASRLQPCRAMMMDSMWDVVGMWLGNTNIDNKFVAGAATVATVVITRGRAADDFLKAESNLWRVGT